LEYDENIGKEDFEPGKANKILDERPTGNEATMGFDAKNKTVLGNKS